MSLINEINDKIFDYRNKNIYGDNPEYIVLTGNNFDELSWECRTDKTTDRNEGYIAMYRGIPVINGDDCLII